MRRSPCYQHYPDRFTQPTKHLSWRARGFFRELQDFMWTESEDYCSVPNDPAAWILAVPGCSIEEAQAMMAEIQNPHKPLLKQEGGRLICAGLRKIREKQIQTSKRRSEAGKLGKQAQLSRQTSDKDLAIAKTDLAIAKKEGGKEKVLTYGVGDGNGVGDKGESEGDIAREFAADLCRLFHQSTPLPPEALRPLLTTGLPPDELRKTFATTLRFVRAFLSGKLENEPGIGTTASRVLASISDPDRPSILDRANAWAAAKGRGSFDPTTSGKSNRHLQPFEAENLTDDERKANAAELTAGLAAALGRQNSTESDANRAPAVTIPEGRK